MARVFIALCHPLLTDPRSRRSVLQSGCSAATASGSRFAPDASTFLTLSTYLRKQLEQRVFIGEAAFSLGQFSELAMHRLNRIGRVNRFTHLSSDAKSPLCRSYNC